MKRRKKLIKIATSNLYANSRIHARITITGIVLLLQKWMVDGIGIEYRGVKSKQPVGKKRWMRWGLDALPEDLQCNIVSYKQIRLGSGDKSLFSQKIERIAKCANLINHICSSFVVYSIVTFRWQSPKVNGTVQPLETILDLELQNILSLR